MLKYIIHALEFNIYKWNYNQYAKTDFKGAKYAGMDLYSFCHLYNSYSKVRVCLMLYYFNYVLKSLISIIMKKIYIPSV